MNLSFSHFPALTDVVACGIRRLMAQIIDIVCSAVVTVLPPGVFMTTMPRRVAAGVSTLSRPEPARPTTFSFSAAAMSSCRDLRSRPDDQAVGVLDFLEQFVLRHLRFHHDGEAGLFQKLNALFRETVAHQNLHAYLPT